jgi:hypothetical protein
MEGNVHDCRGGLSHGSLFSWGNPTPLVPVPFQSVGRTRAEFVFTNGARMTVEANAVSSSVTGEPTFVENFSG